jgi:hypothetical protein
MFSLGVGGAAFGTPVMPSPANGSSPPKDDGGSVGKSERGLLGSRTGVREVCVSEIGKTVFGGAVGISGSRMCIIDATACSVAKHQDNKVTLNVSTSSPTDTYVCIMQRNTKTAFTNLVVPVELLGSARRLQYLSETRQHDQWEMLIINVN